MSSTTIPALVKRAISGLGLVFLGVILSSCRDAGAPPGVETNQSSAAAVTNLPAATAVDDIPTQYASRQAAQAEAARQWPIEHEFRFEDRFAQSGIRFTNRVVDDAGKHYKAVHYDHGNGMAAADVDGDGLLDLYFCNQLGGNQLWRNVGNGVFEDITAAAGVGLDDRISVAPALADVDNDGDPDLFVTTVRMGNALFENIGQGRFRDITREAGVDYTGHSSGATFFDFDRDGWVDLFVANVGVYTTDARGVGGYYVGYRDAFSGHLKPERTEKSLLYRNLGGKRFREVSAEVNLTDTSWSGDATLCDVNEDGWVDLYVANMQGDDHLYLNDAGKKFTESAASYFPKTPWGAMGVKFFDFNGDGSMDLFVTDMHSDMSDAQTKLSQSDATPSFEKRKSEAWCTAQFSESYLQGSSNNVFGNAFYVTRGKVVFAEVSDEIGAETFWPWGLSVGDLNADGFEDAFVTAGMGFGFRYALNSLLLNLQGQRFVDSEFVLGVEPRSQGRTEKRAFVLDCSGADREHPFCRGRTGRVPVSEALSTRSSIIIDLDEDGDLDIVTNEMNDRPQVLVSNLAERRKIAFLKVALNGSRSNRSGLGAIVKVTAGGRTLTQRADGKSGYLAQSIVPLYFGLGAAMQIDQVEVQWPSGQNQRLERPPLNTLLRVNEPAN